MLQGGWGCLSAEPHKEIKDDSSLLIILRNHFSFLCNNQSLSVTEGDSWVDEFEVSKLFLQTGLMTVFADDCQYL